MLRVLKSCALSNSVKEFISPKTWNQTEHLWICDVTTMWIKVWLGEDLLLWEQSNLSFPLKHCYISNQNSMGAIDEIDEVKNK